jgi:tetratricopeptide (TPR) repeat protein
MHKTRPHAGQRACAAHSTALFALVLGVAAQTSASARDCAEWHADLVAAEGTIEVRRVDTTDWAGLARGDIVCTGDSVRAQAFSRATLRLPDQTMIRLDQHSTLTLDERDDGAGSLVKLLRGVIHVISRDPRSLQFSTPHVNAGLKGTEFDIRVDEAEDRTAIAVLEGRVEITNAAGRVDVPSGFVATAHSGEMPAPEPIAEPIELMRWASHFPSIVDGPLPSPDQEPAALANEPQWLAARAASRLEHGDLTAAEADLVAASQLIPSDPTVLALQAIVALGRNDIATARAHAAAATSASPTSAPALIARSYVEQAGGDLTGALSSVQAALAGEPENAIGWTRRAELEVGLGDSSQGLESARRAIALRPSLGYAHSVLGFVLLTRLDVDGAIESFEHASALDQGSPLPQLGLALALMQRGDLLAGRQHLEIAVALDPSNALVRSYMGKTYDAEHRTTLPGSQLELAKRFDPTDPTPWLYDALVKLNRNRPVEALEDLLQASDRNDQRAALRSRLALDPDLATRSAGTGHVLRELGFEQLAEVQGWSAVELDPADYAAHRLLADVYSAEPRHEIARVSEVLTSQLLQPLNLTPIQPQLARTGALPLERAGPSELAFTQFAPLVTTNGLRFEMSSVGGTNGTLGEDLVLAGLHDRLSYSVGQFHYSTDGLREGSAVDERIANAFIQYSPNDRSSVQAELRSNDLQNGDLEYRFDPNAHTTDLEQHDAADSLRIGGRRRLENGDTLIGSIVYQNDTSTAEWPEVFSGRTDDTMKSVEIQHIHQGTWWQLRSGLARQTDRGSLHFTTPGPPATESISDQNAVASSLYAYADLAVSHRLMLTIGAGADSVQDGFIDSHETDPKFGAIWTPNDSITLRASAFKTLTVGLVTSKQNIQGRIEPVQIAGFNQFPFSLNGDTATVYGLGLDGKIQANLFAGVELVERQVGTQVLRLDSAGQPYNTTTPNTEDTGRAYLYWAPVATLSFSARYQLDHFSDPTQSPFGFTEMRIRRLPLETRYFGRSGFTAGVRVSHYHEDGVFQFADGSWQPGADDFWVSDLTLGFRLPKRRGVLSFNIDNLFDKHFRYQDVDTENPSVIPERFAYIRFTLSFQ